MKQIRKFVVGGLRKRVSAIVVPLLVLASSSSVMASVVGFTGAPNSNYTEWAASATGLGASINSSVNFDSHPTGALQNDFYSGLGVNFGSSGDSNTVVFGAGPHNGNNSSTPLSTGEGSHPVSNYLADNGSPSSFIINFATPVYGAGLYVIDYFNPYGDNPLTIEAFDSFNNSLGRFGSVAFNFQPDHMYFMGLTSSDGNISRLVFTDVNSATGDTTGIDNIVFATGTEPIPEPGTILLVGAGLAGLVAFRRRLPRG